VRKAPSSDKDECAFLSWRASCKRVHLIAFAVEAGCYRSVTQNPSNSRFPTSRPSFRTSGSLAPLDLAFPFTPPHLAPACPSFSTHLPLQPSDFSDSTYRSGTHGLGGWVSESKASRGGQEDGRRNTRTIHVTGVDDVMSTAGLDLTVLTMNCRPQRVTSNSRLFHHTAVDRFPVPSRHKSIPPFPPSCGPHRTLPPRYVFRQHESSWQSWQACYVFSNVRSFESRREFCFGLRYTRTISLKTIPSWWEINRDCSVDYLANGIT